MTSYHSRAHIDPNNPEAVGQCDRCAKVFLHKQLRRQMAWRGARVEWTGWLVCSDCLDPPHGQDAVSHPRRDPEPVLNPRREK